MTSLAISAGAAIAGPLEAGSRVGLQMPAGGTCKGTVLCCDGRNLILEFDEEIAEGSLEEGSVLDLFLSLSWGMYKWICIVSCEPGERKAEVQLLDAPMFIQRRLDPRVGVGISATVRPMRSDDVGQPYQAVVADLSHGGLKLEGARQLRAGDAVKVTMELSATLVSLVGEISLLGRVVMAYPSRHCNDYGAVDAHVSFFDGQEKAIEAVDHFVAQQLKCRVRI
ncbi:MAG TPA: PilZ domain-containing protein [Acidimicrobiales bacterium]|nr:PilZ domain-containing protein [Acidimicrobiales bacterium]